MKSFITSRALVLLFAVIFFSCESEEDKRSKELLSADIWKLDATYKNLLASREGEKVIEKQKLKDFYDSRLQYFDKINAARENYNISEKYSALNTAIENFLQASNRMIQTRYNLRLIMAGTDENLYTMNRAVENYERFMKNSTTSSYYSSLAGESKSTAIEAGQKLTRGSAALIDLYEEYDSLITALIKGRNEINQFATDFKIKDIINSELVNNDGSDFLVEQVENFNHKEMATLVAGLDSKFTAASTAYKPKVVRNLMPHEKNYSSPQYETVIGSSYAYLKNLPPGPGSKTLLKVMEGSQVQVYNTDIKDYYYVKVNDTFGYINKWDLKKN